MPSLNQPLVSVVIPNYNGAEFLDESIRSVLNQNYPKLELIVVDDGSTDESLLILQKYDTKIELIRQSNKGSAAARNAGINVANGEFIALLDADDIWEENKISIQMKLIESENYDLVYCSGQQFDAHIRNGQIHAPLYSGCCYQYFKKFPSKGIIQLGCSTAVFRVSLLKSSGLFDESFLGAAEDWDFFRRYVKFGKVGYSSRVLVRYRKHSESITARSLSDFYEGNRRAIVKMFREDAEIGIIERRNIWLKFHLISFKANLKKFQLLESFRLVIRFFRPIT